jgi:hypothetical protein
VLLNWVGPPEEHLTFYAEAFHKAGGTLASQYRNHWPPSSFEACAIVYLYRHALEFYLKAVLVYGSDLLQWRGRVPIDLDKVIGKSSTHVLSNLIPEIGRVFGEAGWGNWDMGIDPFRSRKAFEDIIAEFDRYDKKSFAFRYPMGRKQTASLPRNFSFGMANFIAVMDPFLEALQGAIEGLKQIVDDEQQAG